MKVDKSTVICGCLLLVLLAVTFLQPLQLISSDRVRTTIRIGKTVPLTAIAEVAGGYRCYINDTEYFWLSTDECKQAVGEPSRVKFLVGRPAILYRSET